MPRFLPNDDKKSDLAVKIFVVELVRRRDVSRRSAVVVIVVVLARPLDPIRPEDHAWFKKAGLLLLKACGSKININYAAENRLNTNCNQDTACPEEGYPQT